MMDTKQKMRAVFKGLSPEKMKKILTIFSLAAVLAGCASLQGIVGGITGNNQDDLTGSSQTASSSKESQAGTSSKGIFDQLTKSVTSNLIKNYVIPKSYDAAYALRTDQPDQKMRSIPKNIEALRGTNPAEYIRLITEYINGNSKNDFERIKKAHDLVALLVRYDAASFWANKIPDQSYAAVLKTKLAVCEGYSNLFKKLCDELKIPCEVVHGFGRGVGTSPFAGDTPTDSNHAWNIVSINDDAYLIDCTWDSGHMEGKTAKQEYTTDWLFLKPEQFLHTHFPENSKQQLMEKPLTAKEFLNLPFYKPKFFEIVEKISPALININQVDGSLTIEYTVKDGFEITYSIYDENGGRQFPNNSFSQYEKDKYKSYFSFPSQGKYLLRAFWKKTGAKNGEGCAELGIVSTSGNSVTYPTQFLSTGKNVQIITPIEMPLQGGKKYNFQVRVENKKIVAVVIGKNFIQLTKGKDGIFSGECEIPKNVKDVSIGIADSEKGRYEFIAQYKVN